MEEEVEEAVAATVIEDRSEVQTWFYLTAKLALALSIVRTKPENKSAKEYTEYLAEKISSQDLNWKSKVKELEAEVLRLRQKLLLSNIHLGSALENDGLAALASSQKENTVLINNLSHSEDDSGCDVTNEERMLVDDKSQSCENLWLTSAYSSSFDLPCNSLAATETDFTKIEKTLSTHARFLQDLLGLRKLTESENFLTNFTMLERESSTVSDSVSGLLDGLLSLYKNPTSHFSTLQAEAIHTLTSFISNVKMTNYVLKKCLRKFGEFEKELIGYILGSSSINRFQAQHLMAECLVTLGRCSLIRKPLICLLLGEVSKFVDKLIQIQQDQANYDISHYENICTLFWVLEQLFQEKREECYPSYSEPYEAEILAFLQRLDKTIVHLSDEFPLFAVYTWRLGALFNASQKESDNTL